MAESIVPNGSPEELKVAKDPTSSVPVQQQSMREMRLQSRRTSGSHNNGFTLAEVQAEPEASRLLLDMGQGCGHSWNVTCQHAIIEVEHGKVEVALAKFQRQRLQCHRKKQRTQWVPLLHPGLRLQAQSAKLQPSGLLVAPSSKAR
jgi:hypothetical protein